jgi:hypothetical protein
MTREKFIEEFVKIEIIEDDTFGHYPFQLYAELPNDKVDINALFLGGDVASCYKRFSDYVLCYDNINVFMSIDFPQTADSKHDFVAVFSYENNELTCVAIPYDTTTGEVFDIVTEGEFINIITEQCKRFL